jgi:hypothetical protein
MLMSAFRRKVLHECSVLLNSSRIAYLKVYRVIGFRMRPLELRRRDVP